MSNHITSIETPTEVRRRLAAPHKKDAVRQFFLELLVNPESEFETLQDQCSGLQSFLFLVLSPQPEAEDPLGQARNFIAAKNVEMKGFSDKVR